MDVIYSVLFEGNTTQLLPKITSFLVRLFGFFIFLDFFKYFEKLEKEQTHFIVTDWEEMVVKGQTN